jgi:phasin family protein
MLQCSKTSAATSDLPLFHLPRSITMINTEQITQATKASVETIFGNAGEALQGVEQLVALNVQAFKTSLAEAGEFGKALMAAKGPQEVVGLQTAALQEAPKKAAAYAKQVKEIIEAATAKQRAAAQAQVADVQAKFLEAVTAVLKNAPGSENTLSLVKTAVATANNAYESVNKASKQMTDAVDANVIKFTETAEKAVRTTAAKVKAEA